MVYKQKVLTIIKVLELRNETPLPTITKWSLEDAKGFLPYNQKG